MQATATQSWNGTCPLGASAIVHLVLLLAIIFLHFTPLKPAAPERTVTVELLPADRLEVKDTNKLSDAPKVDAKTENAAQDTTVAKPPSAEIPVVKDQAKDTSTMPETHPSTASQKADAKSKTSALVRAHHFYASEVLRNPKSKGTARDLRQLSPDELMIQLCNLEAMEQVSRWKTRIKADFLVSYAMADTRRTGQRITADGAAIRSKGHWFNLRYSCDVAASLEAVDGFEFLLGDEIPEAEWESHSLPAGENFDD